MAKRTSKKKIEQYEHSDKERANNPHVGLVTPDSDPDTGAKKTYGYDPHLDPQLQWAGKAEHTSFDVPTVSLHVHERIDPHRIIESVKMSPAGVGVGGGRQLSLFAEQKPLREAIDFYKHKEGWTNRLIAGDSLLVMNSLLEKEGMAGKVQMVYFDPPYGIKYGSNFQPFVNKRDVKDGKDEDLSAEPEMIKAFRDTWELGIHSYLTYLRDRLLLVRELLTGSGSVFVQISDENVHHVREILDEIFGTSNFCALITYQKTGGLSSKLLSNNFDFIIWYGKDLNKIKFHNLYVEKSLEKGNADTYSWLRFPDGSHRGMTKDEKLDSRKIPNDAKIYKADNLTSQGNTVLDFEFNGKVFSGGWKTTIDGMKQLAKMGRIHQAKNSIMYVRNFEDFPFLPINKSWDDTSTGSFTDPKIYVVQTAQKAIQRCLLMTTDPGDLVLDITCGSGTTAYVAEQWGRRWITCDTSRVSLTLAKQRLMTTNFDYYKLAHPNEGVGSGFEYKTVPHITLKSIANNEPPATETLYDQPFIDNKKTRVTGPFTVEAVPAPVVKSFEEFHPLSPPPAGDSNVPLTEGDSGGGVAADTSIARTGETLRQSEWRDELLRAGVRAKGGNIIQFTRVEPMAGTKYIQAEAGTKLSPSGGGKGEAPKRVLVVFGPEHAPLEQRMVENAWQEALALKPDMLLFCAFQFDEEAAKDIDELTPAIAGMQLLKAQMNADLLTDDLRKKRSSNESFWLVGQPDVAVSSFEFLVLSNERRLSEYGTFKKLSGLNSLAEINELSQQDIQYYAILSQGRDIWGYLSDEKGWDFNTVKYSRGTGKKQQGRIPSVSWNSTRLTGGIRNLDTDLSEFGIHSEEQCREAVKQLRRDSQIIDSLKEIINESGYPSTINSKLTTKNLTQVEVMGFDYYNPKSGNVESGGKKNIAMWMLDTDYDNRSLFPSQVFFPMAGSGDGWDKLARNLKAEIDEEKIESFRGTISLPFKPGSAVAVKIIDDRGIES